MAQIVFKKRKETRKIKIQLKDLENVSLLQLRMKARQEGFFDTGYHYLLHRNGYLEQDREEDCIATIEAPDALFILADVSTKAKLNAAQKQAIEALTDKYRGSQVVVSYSEV